MDQHLVGAGAGLSRTLGKPRVQGRTRDLANGVAQTLTWLGAIHGRLRLVPTPPAPIHSGAAQSAETQAQRALQLLQRARQHPGSRTGHLSRPACLVQVAATPQPTLASQLGQVQRPAAGFPALSTQGGKIALGNPVSRAGGGAQWWKSPRWDLARAGVGKPAPATLHR